MQYKYLYNLLENNYTNAPLEKSSILNKCFQIVTALI
ncbi:hypothetical protein EDF67_103748 [Sphingobacterium sp. JUb78]|nr:hypothetical protein [Sphingobacterium sp. JUb56]MCW2262679.1 hypothetical protein [Sphingobacterium kitahiroshimense]TCR12328.1 hypothetical protein EDF67_103748 [Sphingobacterium sp. JUb78]